MQLPNRKEITQKGSLLKCPLTVTCMAHVRKKAQVEIPRKRENKEY